jgi:NTE family protein
MKLGIVIEGGGSFGAFTAGRVYGAKRFYDVAVGSSTGALIAPLALLGAFRELKEGYTTISNKDVYSKYPFWSNGVPNMLMFAAAWVKQKKGITDSKPLRQLIEKYYTPDMHRMIDALGKELYVTGCRLNANNKFGVYFKSSDYSHKDFCDLMWASTLIPGLFEPFSKEEMIDGSKVIVDYADGGTVEVVGVKKAVEAKCNYIDVYLHRLKKGGFKEPGKNFVHNAIRALMAQRQEVVDNDETYCMFLSSTNVKFHYLPYKLEGAGMMEFDKEIMNHWFQQGLLNPINL